MSRKSAIEPKRTALVTIDLQNDFLHPEGAYGRAGLHSANLAELPGRVAPVIERVHRGGGSYVSAQFTVVHGRDGRALISPHLLELRPFLGPGDFEPGQRGHALVDSLAPADFTVEKVAYSAFYQTRLEYLLKALEIDTLIFAGIVTNGGVASTVRDSHMRGYRTILLSDGCGAFDGSVHDATLTALASVSEIMTCEAALSLEGLA